MSVKVNVENLREQIEEKSGLKFDEVDTYKSDSKKVSDMLETKLSDLRAFCGGNKSEIKGIAAKYMGKPITDILQEQRKAENLLKDAEETLENFLDVQYEKALKTHVHKSLPEERKAILANEYLTRYIVGSYAREESDPVAYEAHKEYKRLYSEVAKRRTEKNAVLLAKDAFIDDNKELIAEERKQARIRDIRKSGLLRELGIAEEKDEEDID